MNHLNRMTIKLLIVLTEGISDSTGIDQSEKSNHKDLLSLVTPYVHRLHGVHRKVAIII